MITELGVNEVFVFGSNNQGFHGSGAAAMAFRYDLTVDWRKDSFSLTAVRGGNPVGKWAVFGVGRGYMEGMEGSSYGIATVDFNPATGKRTKVPLPDIKEQVVKLVSFAYDNKEKIFLTTKFGTGLAGYKEHEIDALWEGLEVPDNIVFV